MGLPGNRWRAWVIVKSLKSVPLQLLKLYGCSPIRTVIRWMRVLNEQYHRIIFRKATSCSVKWR